MSSGAYLIRDNGQLVEMNEQPCGFEDFLKSLLVKREAGVPSTEGGSDRRSTDPAAFLPE